MIPKTATTLPLAPKGRMLVPAKGHTTHTRLAQHYLAKLAEPDEVGQPVWWVESRANSIEPPLAQILDKSLKLSVLIFRDGSALIRKDIRFLPLTFRLNHGKKSGTLFSRWENLVKETLTGLHTQKILDDARHWQTILEHINDGFGPDNVAPTFRHIRLGSERTQTEINLKYLLQALISQTPWVHGIDLRCGLLADFQGGWIIPPQLFAKPSHNSTPKELEDMKSILNALIKMDGLDWTHMCAQRWQFSSLMGTMSHRKTGPTYRSPMSMTVGTLKRSRGDTTFDTLSAHDKTHLFNLAQHTHPQLGTILLKAL